MSSGINSSFIDRSFRCKPRRKKLSPEESARRKRIRSAKAYNVMRSTEREATANKQRAKAILDAKIRAERRRHIKQIAAHTKARNRQIKMVGHP